MQLVSTTLYSSNMRDMRVDGVGYTAGYAKFWVYEPGTVGNAPAGPNFRVGVAGDGEGVGPDPYTGMINTGMFTANLQQTNAYWRAQWSLEPVLLDGISGANAPSYNYSQKAAAPVRATAGWSYVYVSWGFDNDAGLGWAEWAINRSPTSPNLRADFDNTAVPAANGDRWKALYPITSLFIGDAVAKVQTAGKQGYVDDIEFHGNLVPEPSGLVALGMGLVGLVGIIRRRR